jgi:hypothetical protein
MRRLFISRRHLVSRDSGAFDRRLQDGVVAHHLRRLRHRRRRRKPLGEASKLGKLRRLPVQARYRSFDGCAKEYRVNGAVQRVVEGGT